MTLLVDLTPSIALFNPSFGALAGSKSNTISSDQFNLAAKPLSLSQSEIQALESDFARELNNLRANPSSYINFLEVLACHC